MSKILVIEDDVDFSQDLVRKLGEAGYESEMVSGRIKEGRHRWVAVWVEPITGEVIQKNQGYEKLYNVK